MSDTKEFIGLLVAGFFCALVGMTGGANVAKRQCQAEAVKVGHAEWTIGANGETVFRWKPPVPATDERGE